MASETAVRECSIARTLELLGEKWTLLAVRELMLGSRRFSDIVRYTGAPRDILTQRLRKLEEHGIVRRSEYQERPRRSEYRLTDLGWSLLPLLTMLRAWGDAHLAGPEGPPLSFTHSCGAIVRPVVHCESCGDVLRPQDMRAVPTATSAEP